MSRTPRRSALWFCLLFVLAAVRPAAAAPEALEDSTFAERWTLPNGLEVVTRDVPGASAVSVVWGYHTGLDDDPAGEPGLASLMAEVHFTAAAGDVPARTREEMESLRPQGWSLRVNRRQTLFAETATPAQLAGVLRQVAVRMRGVRVDDALLRGARASVRRLLGARYFGGPDAILQSQPREFARGLDKAGIVALAAAKGLDRETPKRVSQAIARAYVPANGVLVLAGDLGGLNLHAILAREFGDLPAGTRAPDPPPGRLDSVSVVMERSDVRAPAAALGLLAPALADTLHPSFYMAMLLVGMQAKQVWDPAGAPGGSRFQYAMLDDPGFVRLYPPVPGRGPVGPPQVSGAFDDLTDGLFDTMILQDDYENLRASVLWLLGGPMVDAVLDRVRQDPAALNVLATATASRALWGSDAFWAEYRARLEPGRLPDASMWLPWLRDPVHRAVLLLRPAAR